MFQPIAFSVIRQALEWHGFPVPAMRQLSFYEWEEHFSAEYSLTWAASLLRAAGKPIPHQDGDFAYTVIQYDLMDCFSDDCHVITLRWDDDNLILSALLYVELAKVPYQLALLPGD